MNKKTISKVMAELGKRGGNATSKKKSAAARKSLEKARKSRWAKRDAFGSESDEREYVKSTRGR